MKLESFLPFATAKFINYARWHMDELKAHIADVINKNRYDDLDARIAWDVARASGVLRSLRDVPANMANLTALFRRAYKESGIKLIVQQIKNGNGEKIFSRVH